MFIYIAVFACAAALAGLVHRYDRFEKEPLRMVLLALALGFVAMRLVGLAEDAILAYAHLTPEDRAQKAAIIAGIEDGAKLVAVLLIAVAFRKHINDPLDGIIYGTLVGLGAAIDESLLYLGLAGALSALHTLATEFTRLVTHAMLGGVTGFAVGIGARPDRPRRTRPLLILACLLISVAIHFAWDVIAYRPEHHSIPVRLVLMGLMLWLICTWGMMMAVARRRSEMIYANGAGQVTLER